MRRLHAPAKISIPLALMLVGLVLIASCAFPVVSIEEVINVSFTLSPGFEYGPGENGTTYHTRVHGYSSVLRGEITIDGGGVYFNANGYNTQDFKNVYVEDQYAFTVDPADDLYWFVFNNTSGGSESDIAFRLEEVWTAPLAFSSFPMIILAVTSLFLFLIGLLGMVITRVRRVRTGNSDVF
ncbi:MAG: hypothetical protein ACE5H4_07045 [Candidatus Thorarchaeota archaeon]